MRITDPPPDRASAGMPYLASRKQPPAPGEQIAVPTTVLWPEHDPLFPRDWSDRLDEFFSDISIRFIDGAGHFAPLEYPAEFAAAIRAALDRTRGPETARRGDH